jgi:hypothetical protein
VEEEETKTFEAKEKKDESQIQVDHPALIIHPRSFLMGNVAFSN